MLLFRRYKLFLSLFLFYLFPSFAQELDQLQKSTDDIDNKFTNVSKFGLGLTVTNYGTIGTRNNFWPTQPSAEYPRGSRIEHIYQGGIWVGAHIKTKDSLDPRNDLFLVSTGASDRTYRNKYQHLIRGYEFNSDLGDGITEISNLTDDRVPSSDFSTRAVSHQDFICNYSDTKTRIPATGDSIDGHISMGLKIHQESYAWNFPFADFFVILRYTIYNASQDTLDSVYVGYWNNAVVRNTNEVKPGPNSPLYFERTGQGYDSTRRMAYSFDFNGAPGTTPANSYVGFKLLGTTPFPSGVDSLGNLKTHTYYNAWLYPTVSSSDPIYHSPELDYDADPYNSRYSRLTSSIPQDHIDPLRILPQNVSYLLSTGPYTRLNPNDSIEIVFSVVCAKKFGDLPPWLDLEPQRKTLYSNADWAQKTYNGEDINGNNKLDPGEDIATRDSLGLRYEPDGKITRYLLPAPPQKPKVHVEVGNQKAVLYWDNSSELSIDPVTNTKDFEGYRIYRSNVGLDFQNHDSFLMNLSLIGDFDRADDNIGYNAGFSQVALDTPITFEPDSIICHRIRVDSVICDTIRAVRYYYRFPPKGVDETLLNGWQYILGVSAYDKGDSVNNVESLESAKSIYRIIPGTPPPINKSAVVGVYPNPYYVNAYWDGSFERHRKIYFYNLPASCEIKIYTLAGDIVTVLDHDASTYKGTDIEWFNQFGDPNTQPKFAGGEHAWDLITKYDQAIATGLYLFTVEDKTTHDVKRGKFMIIK